MNPYLEKTIQSQARATADRLKHLGDMYGPWFDIQWEKRYKPAIDQACEDGKTAIILNPQWPPSLRFKSWWERFKSYVTGSTRKDNARADYLFWLRHKLHDLEGLKLETCYWDYGHAIQRNIAYWGSDRIVVVGDLP